MPWWFSLSTWTKAQQRLSLGILGLMNRAWSAISFFLLESVGWNSPSYPMITTNMNVEILKINGSMDLVFFGDPCGEFVLSRKNTKKKLLNQLPGISYSFSNNHGSGKWIKWTPWRRFQLIWKWAPFSSELWLWEEGIGRVSVIFPVNVMPCPSQGAGIRWGRRGVGFGQPQGKPQGAPGAWKCGEGLHVYYIHHQEESLRFLKVWVMTWNLCRIDLSCPFCVAGVARSIITPF